MEKILDGVKYILIPIPPYASPYSSLIGDLLRKKPQTLEEAQKIAAEIKKTMNQLFADTITPTPKPEHYTQLFNTLTKLTTEVMEQAGLFRKDSGPNAEKGEQDEAASAQEA